MFPSLKNVLYATTLIGCSLIANDQYPINERYSVTMGTNDSLKITLNSYQKVNSTQEPGKKIDFPHLWKLDGLLNQSLVRLSDETKKTSDGKDYRVYDLMHGHKEYSTANTLASIMLMPVCFLGFATLTPYEQEYLFYTNNITGSTSLTFICEKRYCWEAPTKVVTVDIFVNESTKSKNQTLYIK